MDPGEDLEPPESDEAKTELHFALTMAVMKTAKVAGLLAGEAMEDPTWNRRLTEIREVTKYLRRANALADMVG